MTPNFSKVVLVIMDGLGLAGPGRGNAVDAAGPKVLNRLVSMYPAVSLRASGPLVGLPWGEAGNSEVGHLNIGAGRIVAQDLPRIDSSITDGSFYKNPVLEEVLGHLKKTNGTLHLVGLLSPGGVHSSEKHVYALISWCAHVGLGKVQLHVFADGRDTPQKAIKPSLEKLEEHMTREGVGRIASIAGRFFAMDRGGHWQQTLATYRAIVQQQGPTSDSVLAAIEGSYSTGVYDEMIPPTVIARSISDLGKVEEGDAVICFNFRQDRMLQLTSALTTPEKTPLAKDVVPLKNVFFATMTEYDKDFPVRVMYAPQKLSKHLSEVVSDAGLKQFHIAESEKYTHVTMFFNGGNYAPLVGEERLIIESPTNNSKNYIDHPEMSSEKLTLELCKRITSSSDTLLVANFANPDMVGHTGSFGAALSAVRAVDECLGKIVDAARQVNCAVLITADHGNVEQMISPKTGQIDKDHTSNPVPCILVADQFMRSMPAKLNLATLSAQTPEGSVSDVAPTVLELLGLTVPPDMTAVSLLTVFKAQMQGVPV